ncbi:hypothetical protein BVRB_1g011750 [Beta vulgaris subsp. vulgaris]|uniref:thioredoxin Y1, chloroplastic n=1 Tax=Beta vulgaris subsp. vulgaris TaxID=3555 RepID=UPI00053F8EC1|nr:thioredoxin Y1, chloroplastic [Beta vulgaris subsp. vulgaris]KMT19556.1 hypothetical protein BVRB_1g011750 [Beta vulgaris subsp. vulgaris]
MAISLPSATMSSLTSDQSCNFICSRTTTTSCSLSKSSSLSLSSLQLQFPWQLRRQFRIRNSRSISHQRSRILPLVKAKQQTFSSFDELIANSEKPVLVDFYATWCGPCQFMVPILEQVNAALKDKIQVVKIDTEKYPEIAGKYKIEALPTFILFKDGKPCDRFEGAVAADKLTQRIETSLAVKS